VNSRNVYLAFVFVLIAGFFVLLTVREERTISTLKSRILQLGSGQGRSEASSAPPNASEEIIALRRDAAEVHKLRNEMHAIKEADADLRRRISDLLRQISFTKVRTGEMTNECRLFPGPHAYTEAEQAAQAYVDKQVQALSQWWQAFLAYAKEHDGKLPTNAAAALSYLPPGFQNDLNVENFYLPPSEPETLESISNLHVRAVFADRQGVLLPDGRLVQVMFFADGHAGTFVKNIDNNSPPPAEFRE
jgi:hypothetical protein